MRRHLALGFLCALLLTSCAERVAGLPPAEVLSRAGQAGQKLQSVTYALKGTFSVQSADAWSAEGKATIDGKLQDGGKQMQFTLDIDADVQQEGEAFDLLGNLEVINVGGDEVYLFVHALSTDPPSRIFNTRLVESVVGTWWLLSSGEEGPSERPGRAGTPSATVTPDPRLLRAQAEVVQVVQDRGIGNINGHEAYHYDVAIDPEKFLAYLLQVSKEREEEFDAEAVKSALQLLNARGELWIDSETFYVHSLSWEIKQLALGDGRTISTSFTVELGNHDAVAPIVPPEDAQPFSPLGLDFMDMR